MATITGFTAARMKAIEDSCVVSGAILLDDLILTRRDGTEFNAGNVRGPKGSDGAQGLPGQPGVQGVPGVGPTGSISMFAGETAPEGHLLCDGRAISRTTYSALYDVIGTAYGAGDGNTTFNIPNLKGRVPVGMDGAQTEFDVLGERGGAKTHTLSVSEMPAHTHTQNAHTHTFSDTTTSNGAHTHDMRFQGLGGPGTGNIFFANGTGGQAGGAVVSAGAHTHDVSGTTSSVTPTNNNTGGGGSHNNLQPYIVLNYIIKI